MSFESSAATVTAAPRPQMEIAADHRPPPEIRVDPDDDGAAVPAPAAADLVWTGDERRRSMPVNHSRFVDEPYVFSLSQTLAMTSRRRSEPFMDAVGTAETRPTSRVLVEKVQSSGRRASPERTRDVLAEERCNSAGAIPKTSTTTAESLDEPSRLPLSSSFHDSDDEQLTSPAGSRFLSLPQTSDYLSVPARRHSVALLQPTTSRILDVIAEEAAVATEAKSLASSRRYSLSCQLNT